MLQKKKNEGVKKVAVCMVRGLEREKTERKYKRKLETKAMTTLSHCNTGITLPINTTEKLPYLYTLLRKSQ